MKGLTGTPTTVTMISAAAGEDDPCCRCLSGPPPLAAQRGAAWRGVRRGGCRHCAISGVAMLRSSTFGTWRCGWDAHIPFHARAAGSGQPTPALTEPFRVSPHLLLLPTAPRPAGGRPGCGLGDMLLARGNQSSGCARLLCSRRACARVYSFLSQDHRKRWFPT